MFQKFCQGPRHRLALTSWVCWISKRSFGCHNSDSQNRNQDKSDFPKAISFQIRFVPFSTRLGSRRSTRCFDAYFQDPCAAPRKVHPREFPLFLGTKMQMFWNCFKVWFALASNTATSSDTCQWIFKKTYWIGMYTQNQEEYGLMVQTVQIVETSTSVLALTGQYIPSMP